MAKRRLPPLSLRRLNPDLLTGITDELGVRVETYRYDSQRRVTETSLAGGADRVTFSYPTGQFGNPRTEVVEHGAADSSVRTYDFIRAAGSIAWTPKSVTAPCSLCGATQAKSQYTVEGWLFKTTDYDNTVTFYQYDLSGRITERAKFPVANRYAYTRPPLSEATQVTSIRWHPVWNLPETVAEPQSITAYGYDGRGHLKSESWSATTDMTGAAGLEPVKMGGMFRRTWTYNGANLLQTATESMDDVESGRLTFAYDTSGLGQIRSVTDMRNARTGLVDRHDAHGRVLDAISDLGVLLGYRYGPRGFMTTVSTGGQVVRIDQNAIGLTTDATMPDGQTIHYAYDPSHRLIEVQINGIATSSAMLRAGSVPRDRHRGWWLARIATLKKGFESLIPAATAQVPVPPRLWPVVPIPGSPGPGQPYIVGPANFTPPSPSSIEPRHVLQHEVSRDSILLSLD